MNEAFIVSEAQPATEMSRSYPWISPAIKHWLREPLVHFLLLGLALFACLRLHAPGRGGVESSRQIVLSSR